METISREQAEKALERLKKPHVEFDGPPLWYWVEQGGVVAAGDLSLLARYAAQCLAQPASEDAKVVRDALEGFRSSFSNDDAEQIHYCEAALAALARMEAAQGKPGPCLTSEEMSVLGDIWHEMRHGEGISWLPANAESVIRSLLSRPACPHEARVKELEGELAGARGGDRDWNRLLKDLGYAEALAADWKNAARHVRRALESQATELAEARAECERLRAETVRRVEFIFRALKMWRDEEMTTTELECVIVRHAPDLRAAAKEASHD